MTDTLVQSPALASGAAEPRSAVSRLARSVLCRAIAAGTRHALDGLSDELLRDNGLTRGDIPFVAETLAAGATDLTRDPLDRLNRSVMERRVAR